MEAVGIVDRMKAGAQYFLVIFLMVFGTPLCRAVDGIWTYNGNNNWGNGGCWQSGQIANGVNGTADISLTDINGNRTIVLNADRTIGNLIFSDYINTGNDWILARGSPAGILTLDVYTGVPAISVHLRPATVTAAIAGTNGIAKKGMGTLVLAATNSYTGSTVVNNGVLILDFSQSLSPATNIINSSSPLVMSGGAMLLVGGNASAANSQTFSGLTVSNSHVSLTATNGAGGTVILNPGGIVRQGFATVNFNPPASGSIVITNANLNGIIGCYATVNSNNWAANNGANAVVAYAGYTADIWGPANNVNVTASRSITNSTCNSLRFDNSSACALALSGTNTLAAGGIMFTPNSASGSTITNGFITSATGELIVHDNHNVDRRSTVSSTIGSAIINNGATPLSLRIVGHGAYFSMMPQGSGANLTALTNVNNSYTGGTHLYGGGLYLYSDTSLGAVPAAPGVNLTAASGMCWLKARSAMATHTNRSIHIASNAYLAVDGGNTITIEGVISGGGTLMGPPNYGGYVILNGTNTLTGTIIANNAGLRMAEGVGLPASANLILSGMGGDQGVVEMSGTFTRDLGYGPGQVAWGSPVYNYYGGGFAAVGGPLTVNIGGNGSNLVFGRQYFNPGSQNYLQLGNPNSTHTLTWVNPIDMNSVGGTRWIYVRGTAVMQGAISGNSCQLCKNLPGTLALAATNTYSGGTRIDGGAININFDDALGAVPVGPANDIRFYGSAALQAGADVDITTNRNIWINNNLTATLDSSNYNMTVNGAISGFAAVTKTGSGKLVLKGASTYTGVTTINNGTLVLEGSLAVESSVVVTNTGFLGGSGTVGGPVTVLAGTGLTPGGTNSGGVLTVNNSLAIRSGTYFNWRYDSTPGRVVLASQLALSSGGTYTIRLYNPGGLAHPVGQQFEIITWPAGAQDPETNVTWIVEKAAGGGAEGWALPLVTVDTANNRILLTFPASGTPAVDNGAGATSILTNSAVLNGNYTATGTTAEVWIYWGASDGGTNKGSWPYCYTNGAMGVGSLSTSVTNLYYGPRYYYRNYASNAVGDVWSQASSNFVTLQPVNYANGLRGSVFSSVTASSYINLSDSPYNVSYSRVFTGFKASTVLSIVEDPQWNVIVTGQISGFGMFSGYGASGRAYAAVAFSGVLTPRYSGAHNFRWDCDDSGMMYIDLNNDGTFQAGEGVVGAQAWAANGNVTLTANQEYNFIFMSMNYAGPGTVNFWVTEPGQSEVRADTTVQAGMWRYWTSGIGLNHNAPTNITPNSAVMNASLISSGAVAELWAYWGTVDRTNNPSAWQNSALVGTYTNVITNISYTVTGLASDNVYYMRFRAVNGAFSSWSDVRSAVTMFDQAERRYRMKITFSGYNRPETLTNFPALVVLSESITNFSYSQVGSPHAADLRFTDETQINELNYEIERWDPGGGLALWLKSDAGVVTNSSGNVVRWQDQSGLQNDAWNATGNGPLYQVNALNGLPVLSFNNSLQNYLRNTNWAPGFNLSGQMTCFFVSKIMTNSNYAGFFAQLAATGNDYDNNAAFDVEQNVTGTGTNGIKYHRNGNPSISVLRDNSIYRIDAVRGNAAGMQTYLDGVAQGTSGTSFAGALNPVEYAIGARLARSPSAHGKVDFAEIIVYRAGLTDAEMNRVGYYLTQKYGLTTSYTPASYLPTSGQSYAWVKVPNFTNNCSIWAYWGNTNATVPPAYTADGSTWDDTFLLVSHLNENSSNSASSVYNGTATSATNATGFIAGGKGFTGGSSYVDYGNINEINNASLFSVDMWVKSSDTGDGDLMTKGAHTTGVPLLFWRDDVTSSGTIDSYAALLNNDRIDGGNGLCNNDWQHVSFTYGNSQLRLYVNGVEDSFASPASAPGNTASNTSPVRIGADNSGGTGFLGLMDEIRISSVKRSSNWIWACYMTQASNGVFNTYSPAMGIVNSAATNITSTSAVLNAVLIVGGGGADVWVYWGSTNGGNNPGAWANSNLVGNFSGVGTNYINYTVGSLVPDNNYFFKFQATNAESTAWALDTLTFGTLPSFGAYAHKMRINFNGYNKNETLTNFSALVTVSENLPDFLYGQLKVGAADLRFLNESETMELNYELDNWNTNGTSQIWVQVPQFTNNCSIWMYWGNAAAQVPSYSTNGAAWTEDFGAVWHMSQADVRDSTANVNTGAANGNTNVAGLINTAQNFNGAGNYLEVQHSESVGLYGSNCTVQVLVKASSVIGDNREIIGKVGWTSSTWSYNLHLYDQGQIHFNVNVGGNDLTSANTSIADGTWHMLSAVRRYNLQELYFDGELIASKACGTAMPGNTENLRMGAWWANDPNYFIGSMDEVRLSTKAYSSNWQWACWMNVASNGAFSTFYAIAGITNGPASSITSTSAVLGAALYASNLTLGVNVYWDTNNWGTNVTSWTNYVYAGSWTNVVLANISCLVTGFNPDVQYYYKFRATNGTDDIWAPGALGFKTAFSPSSPAYPYRMNITFSGYGRNETLTNFPALVSLSQGTNGFFYRQLKAAGMDLRFADVFTNELKYEVESWDSNGTSHVWVQVPQFTNNCSIWAYWGNSNAPTASYTTNGAAWETNFRGVWHMTEANARDSTSFRNNGASGGNINGEGRVGVAQNFNSQWITVDNPGNFVIRSNIAVSTWVKVTGGWINNWQAFVAKQGESYGWALRRYNDRPGGSWTLRGTPGGDDGTIGIASIGDGQWHYMYATYDGTNRYMYVDGVVDGYQADSGLITLNGAPITIGAEYGNTFPHRGLLDEVRIETYPRSSNWIWACYMNQASNGSFGVQGAVEGGVLPVVNNGIGASRITLDSALLNGYLVSTGGAMPSVKVYWGNTDGGTNKSNWARTNDISVAGVGPVSTNMFSLACATNYFYRYYASNTYGDCWAPSTAGFSTHRYRMKVQFQGYDKSEPLANFPAAVILTEGVNGFSHKQNSSTVGGDLRFANSNETVILNHEIEKWDTNGSSCAWVKVPEFVSNCWIWVYWGGPETNPPAYTTNGMVWSQDYLSVWHMSATNNAAVYPDSTSYRFNGVNYGAVNVPGKIGSAADFNGGLKYLDVTGIACSSTNYTFNYWLRIGTNGGYLTDMNIGRLITRMENGTLRTYDSSGQWRTTIGSYVNDLQWRHAVFVLNGDTGTGSIYLDGVLAGSGIAYQPTRISGTAKIACDQGGPQWNHFDGAMDEIQISTVVRSSNWIWACYMNQGSNAVFCSNSLPESTSYPVVNNDGGASNVNFSSAYLRGYLASTGITPTTVTVYWGTADGGTNKGGWGSSINMGQPAVGLMATNVSGLACGTKYYYRYYATNSAGDCWAPSSTSFSASRYRMKITFSGYDKIETLTNFPMLVTLREGGSGFSYGQCTSTNGGELRFANSNETVTLNYEVESWDTNGNSCVWVQVPEFISNGWIWVYWGGVDADPPLYSINGSAWDSSFKGVWHLKDAVTDEAIGGINYDSTGNLNNGAQNRNSSTTGKIAGAQYFDGTDDYVRLGRVVPAGSYTKEAWVKRDFGSGNNIISGPSHAFWAPNGGVLASGHTNSWYFVQDPSPLLDLAWLRVAVTYEYGNPGKMILYRDGVEISRSTTAGPHTFDVINYIGAHGGGTVWKGIIDEARVSGIARSSNWLWSCWMNEGSNDTYYTVTPVESTTLPIVNNDAGASNVLQNSAFLNGFLTSTGGASTAVTVYWGANDGGTNKAAWTNSIYMGVQTGGLMSTNVTGLVGGSRYYYRYYATNSPGDCWSRNTSTFVPSYYKMKITFSGYTRAETLTNFPALVKLNEDMPGFIYGQFSSGSGGDLRFVNSNETAMLAHEIEEFNTGGYSYVWVKVPELTSNACVWAYWGSSDTNPPPYTVNGSTWSEGYAGVWHMNQTNTLNCAPSDLRPAYSYYNISAAGIISTGQQFNGVGSYLDALDGFSDFTTGLTISVWCNPSLARNWARFIDFGRGAGVDNILFARDGTTASMACHMYTNSGNSGMYMSVMNAINLDVWQNLVVSLDSSRNVTFYRNGYPVAAGVFAALPRRVQRTSNYIGKSNWSDEYYEGLMDELRFSAVSRSSNWIWACYMSVASNSLFISASNVVTLTRPIVSNNDGAGNVGFTSADLVGYLTSTGVLPTAVSVYWGTSDGGTNKGSWGASVDKGTPAVGSVSANLAILTEGTTYYYRYYASNSFADAWAPSSAIFVTSQNSTNNYKMRISFGGYNRGETLTNFPVLLTLDETLPGFRYSQFSSPAGGDLRLVNSNETASLNFEIEQWDPAPVNPSPTNVSGLALWLKADAGVTTNSSGFVSGWADQSGNGKHATQAGLNYQPARVGNVLNGKPVIRFDGMTDGTGDYMDVPQIVVRTVFMVLNYADDVFMNNYPTAFGDQIYGLYVVQGRPLVALLNNSLTGVYYINGRMPSVINGGYDFTPMTSHKIVAVSLSIDRVMMPRLGKDRTDNGRMWKGDFAEIIVYDRILTAPEMNAIGVYLTQKYGISTTYSQGAGKSYVWVQVPEFTSNSCVWAYWGNPVLTNLPVSSTDGSAWDSTFRAVWHMGEVDALDSTANVNHGLGNGNVPDAGKIASAQSFNGNGNFIELSGRRDSLNLYTNLTISAWLYHHTGAGWNFAYAAGDTVTNTLTYTIGVSDSYRWNTEFNSGGGLAGPTAVSETMAWHHLAFVYDYIAGKTYFYHDGVQYASASRSGTIRYSDKFKIGCKHDIWGWWSGYIDELRLDSVPRSANWIWASCMNQGGSSLTAYDPPLSITAPIVENSAGVSNVMWDSATLNGYLCSTGGAPASVWLYWGTIDGGSNKANWSIVVPLGAQVQGPLSTGLTSLTNGISYYYRYYASNSIGDCWAPSTVAFMPQKFRMKLTFAGYGRDETLTNFPLLVTLDEGYNSFSYSQMASPYGWDLRFVSSNETAYLNHEIEQWDSSAVANPTNVPGLVLWLKADAGLQTNAGGSVGSWTDQSPSGRSASQGVPTNCPAYVTNVLNGLPVVRFDGGGDQLTWPAVAAQTVFVVNRVATGAKTYAGLLGYYGKDRGIRRDSATLWRHPGSVNDFTYAAGSIININGDKTAVVAEDTWHILTAVRCGGSQYIDCMGAYYGGREFAGDCAEVIIYNRALKMSEQNRVGWYLAQKYGLTASYVQPSGTSYIWVQVPELVTNGYIWAYWGNASATNLPSYALDGSTWDSNYKNVMHFHEAGIHDDSTANRNVGAFNGNIGLSTEGEIGGAYSFYGQDGDDYVAINNSSSLENIQENNYTLEAWCKPASVPPGSGDQNNAHYGILEKAGNHLGLRYANSKQFVAEHWWINGGATQGLSRSSIAAYDPGIFHHVVQVLDRTAGALKLYVDGYAQGTTTFTPGAASREYGTGTWKAGCANPGAGTYRWSADGMIDEVRISDIARSSNWLWACYMNMASNSLFVSNTTVQSISAPVISNDGGASNVLTTSAILNGYLSSTGGAPTTVAVYWGQTDGGTNKAGWSNPVSFGVQTPGLLSLQLNSLISGATYYYRYYASNSIGSAWAPSTISFMPSGYKTRVFFNGYSKDETLTNFPALVVFDSGLANFAYSQFASPADGGDLRFMNSNETALLNYEIERWDPSLPIETPTNIANCMLWLRSDSGVVTNLTGVTNWIDQSGHANSAWAAPSREPAYVTNVVNGKPVVRFDGVTNYLKNAGWAPGFNVSGQMTYFFVSKVGTNGATRGFFAQRAANTNDYGDNASMSIEQLTTGLGGIRYHRNANPSIDVLRDNSIFRVDAIRVNALGTQVYQDGVLQYSNTMSFAGALAPAEYAIGARLTAAGDTNGLLGYGMVDFAEIIIYKTAITDLQLNQVGSYLAQKYGLGTSYQVPGMSYVWVQVPELVSNGWVWAYWGEPGNITPPAYTLNGSTWDASYKGVWHLHGLNPLNLVSDSSAALNHGSSVGITKTLGLIANSGRFETNTYATLPNSIGNSSLGSVSLWINTTRNYSGAQMLYYGSVVASGDGFGGENEFHLNLDPSEQPQLMIIGTPNVSIGSTVNCADGLWHHLAATWDINGSAVLYVDGVKRSSAAHDANNFVFSATHRLGRPYATSGERFYSGRMDEVRLSNITRSSNWIWACYMNQASNSAFQALQSGYDSDGDGVSDTQEIIAGTNPNDPVSVMKITAMAPQGAADINLQFNVGGNRIVNLLAANSPGSAKSLLRSVTNDGAETPVTWIDAGAVSNTSRRFYTLSVSYAGSAFTNTQDWAMYVQPRVAGRWHMAGVPIDFETSGENSLSSSMGTQMMRGVKQVTGADTNGDQIYIMTDTNRSFVRHWVTNSQWWALGSGGPEATNTVIRPTMGFWVQRKGASNTNTVYTGKARTNMVYIVAISNNWNFLQWPFKSDRAENSGWNTPNVGWGFKKCGAVGSADPAAADTIMVVVSNSWKRYYMLDGTVDATLKGRWWDYNRGGYADFTMQAGQGFYYYHRGSGFVWTNSYGP